MFSSSSIVTTMIGLTYTNKIWARSIIILCILDCQTIAFKSMLHQVVSLASDSQIRLLSSNCWKGLYCILHFCISSEIQISVEVR